MAFDQNGFELADAPVVGVDENGFEFVPDQSFDSQNPLRGPSAAELSFGDTITRAGMGLSPFIPSNDLSRPPMQETIGPAQPINAGDQFESWAARKIGPLVGYNAEAEAAGDEPSMAGKFIEQISSTPIGLSKFKKENGKTVIDKAKLTPVGENEEGTPGLSISGPDAWLLEALPEGKIKDIGAGTYNAVATLANFFLSPLGASMGGMSKLPETARRSISAKFAWDMANSFPQQVEAGLEAYKNGDTMGAVENWLGGAGTAIFAGAAGKHALEPRRASLPMMEKEVGKTQEVLPTDISKETGYDYDAKMEQMVPDRWHFTDRRQGSPTASASITVPKGASAKDVSDAFSAWEKQNSATSPQVQASEAASGTANATPSVGGTPKAVSSPVRVEGESEKMRKSAERATTAESVPEPVQERIAAAPESRYKVQPQEDVRNVVGAMTDLELAAVPKDSNIHVASQLELSKRLFDQGKNDEGYNVFQAISQTGTDLGQNINQFKMLKGATPFHVVELVNQGLKKAGKDPLTKTQADTVAKISNASIDANKTLDAAKNEWQKNPTDANAKLADEALQSAHKADLETQQKINQYSPKSWPRMLKAFVQGNPLTPISQVANVVGNVMGAGMEAGSRGVGSFVDSVRTMFTKGDRQLEVSPVSGPKAALVGGVKALKQSGEIMLRGSGDVVKGEFRQNLRPLRALATAFAKNPDVPTVGGKVPFGERARLAVEGTFGIPPEIMLRLLSAADKPSYEAARARLINEQSSISKVPKEQRSMAQKFPELFFDREALKRIQGESENAVFQNKSVGISYLESWIKQHGGDWADLAFTMMVAPYRLTPWNLVGRTLIYNPLLAAVRTAYYAKKGNTRQAELNAGRLVVGSMLYGAGYFIYKNGLIGPSLDSRDETKKERLLAGEVLPPNHVNISGLNRLKSGGDPSFKPGDETWDLTRGGGAAGAILSSVANIGRDFEKKPEGNGELVASLLKNSTLEQASFTINQSFLKGVTGILDAVRDRNIDPYMRSVESMFMNVATPNTLTTLSRATRKYAPDLRGDTAKNDLENLARERFGTMGLDDYLPLKRDLWGKPMLQTPEGRNAILYHLFDISKNRQVTSDPVTLELYDLWRTTANREVVPSIPERQITLQNKTVPLNPQQYERYVELVGGKRREIMDALIVNPQFQNLSKENKIKVIERAYRNGLNIGKRLFVSEVPAQELAEPKKPKAGFQAAK